MNRKKRVVFISDTHCGGRGGLTSPEYQYKFPYPGPIEEMCARYQRSLWNWYVKTMDDLKPIHLLVANGDLIDGRDEKSIVDIMWPDRGKQVDMAVNVIKAANAEKVEIVRGTDFHTGKSENWEDLIAEILHISKPSMN